MSDLFEATQINGMLLANRFVRSATWTGLADDDGNVTPPLSHVMEELAKGGIGLIITGHAYVHPSGRHAPWQLGMDNDDQIEGLRAMTEAVHRHGGRIAVQLGYGGAYLSKSRLRQMSRTDIRLLADAYAASAVRARKAGFDGLQIMAAHGFLLSQFLCPRYNDRNDDYGGIIENRARALLTVLDVVRRSVGKDYPLMVKLNCLDGIADGLTLEESLRVAEMLQTGGVDAIELSGGLLNNPNVLASRTKEGAYFESEARAFRERIMVPLMLVGGIRSFDTSRRLVADGVVDYISLCRPLICEPALISRWKAGDLRDAACISCNNCVEQIKQGKGVACVPETEEPVPSFYVQTTDIVPASPPLPEGACYVISFGLRQTGAALLPMARIHMSLPGDEREHPPFFPLESKDHEKVTKAVQALFDSRQNDVPPQT